MDPNPMEWKTPQICLDCRTLVEEGWQELKRSGGGHYIEKRCGPCAEEHYGKTFIGKLGAPAKKAKSQKETSGDITIGMLIERMG